MSDNMKSALDLRMTVCCALFTALTIIGGYISIPIPIGPVPIALADFFAMLAGIFLGVKYGLASTALYLILGAFGLPVFAGGKAGLAVLFGPTGGFLFGYLLTAACTGAVIGRKKHSAVRILAALAAGNIVLYAVGVPWLKIRMGMSWPAALAAGLTPFVPGIMIKIAAAAAIARLFLPRFQQTMASSVVDVLHNAGTNGVKN